jgi:hypothetical protein
MKDKIPTDKMIEKFNNRVINLEEKIIAVKRLAPKFETFNDDAFFEILSGCKKLGRDWHGGYNKCKYQPVNYSKSLKIIKSLEKYLEFCIKTVG